MNWVAANFVSALFLGVYDLCSKRVTCNFTRLMTGATEMKCPQFGDNIISHR